MACIKGINDSFVIHYLKSATTFWNVVLLYLPGCGLMFLFQMVLFSWHFFSWASLAGYSMFFPSETNCQLKFSTADIANGFWVSSLQYVVFAHYFASRIASSLLVSDHVFCYCEFHRFLKVLDSLFFCDHCTHSYFRGGTVSIVWPKWWTSHHDVSNCWLLSHECESSSHS